MQSLPRRFHPRGARRALVVTTLIWAAAAVPLGSSAQDRPRHGGTLSVGTPLVTLSPQSWDPADWNYKTADDAGYFYDRLLVADLSRKRARGGPHRFLADSFLPPDAVRGDLAESWRWMENPLRLEMKLRKGVMFPDKPGVMAARPLTAQDVLFSYQRLTSSAKKVPEFFDYLEKLEATDPHTIVFTFRHFQEDWDYRFGWGILSSIYPKEVVDAGIANWKNANGTGPFQLTEHVQGNSQTYTRNPVYWGKEPFGADSLQLPFVDRVVVRTLKDEATQHAALRTAKLDLLQTITWTAAEELKKSAPHLKWSRRLAQGGGYLAMRTDTKPFDDLRVRRALNMAVNKQEIAQLFYGGNAEVFAHPQHPDFPGYFEPLEAMPESIRELYVYDPDKARKLLAEAGYPRGFSFKAQVCSCNPAQMDLLPLVVAYLEKVGVKLEIEPLEQGAFSSLMRNGKNAPGFFIANSIGNPTLSLRKNFVKGQYTNNSQWDDPAFAKKLEAVYRERDETMRQKMVRELTRDILEKAPYLWLPTAYLYTAWWPWVKNYDGELYAGGFWLSPVYARVWIDQDLKKKMGY